MSKYKAKKMEIDGRKFDSKLEARYYLHLKDELAKGNIKKFEFQPEFILQEKFKKNGKTFREIKYIADFKVFRHDGSVYYVDTKGIETADFKLKKKLFHYKYREAELYLMKYVVKFGGWITDEEYKKRKKGEIKK